MQHYRQAHTKRTRRAAQPRGQDRFSERGRPAIPRAYDDWLREWNDLYAAPLVEGWSRMMDDVLEPWTRTRAPRPGTYRRPHPKGYGCDCCDCGGCDCGGCDCGGCDCGGSCDCRCRCCVADADLLVHARVGEHRVAPIVIENNLRRPRDIELELSSWTTHSGQPVEVKGVIDAPTQFTLQPCEERTVKLHVDVVGGTPSSDTPPTNIPPQDVDTCTVYYADLRVKGCDIRPIRIAVAVLPCACVPYRIDCRCTCCC